MFIWDMNILNTHFAILCFSTSCNFSSICLSRRSVSYDFSNLHVSNLNSLTHICCRKHQGWQLVHSAQIGCWWANMDGFMHLECFYYFQQLIACKHKPHDKLKMFWHVSWNHTSHCQEIFACCHKVWEHINTVFSQVTLSSLANKLYKAEAPKCIANWWPIC